MQYAQTLLTLLLTVGVVMALGVAAYADAPVFEAATLGWDRFGSPSIVRLAAHSQPAAELPEQIEFGGAVYERRKSAGDEPEGPKNIADNSFLLEEAYNQEPGVVQHIFNWAYAWDGPARGRSRDLARSYLIELPLGSQTHQLSFLTLWRNFVDASGAVSNEQGGIGDTLINYRYQLLLEDWGDAISVAPRFSVIVPTGDESRDLGFGQVGYQCNLPMSKKFERFDCHFNAGFTAVPGVTVDLGNGVFSSPEDLWITNFGASLFWKPQTYFHVFVENLVLVGDRLDDFGVATQSTVVIVNPGVRYAICQLDDVEWVVGASVPIGVTPDAPDIGVFLYMSVEHTFVKK